MNNYQRAKRRVTAVTLIMGALFYAMLIIIPAIGGYITAEQPIASQQR
nr:hypothetical protein [uncultured Pseudomonas sp.]